jgi:hypothetical protein
VKHRRQVYLLLMGVAVLLVSLAWFVVYRWSRPAAALMSAVAAVIPPVAAILANNKQE